MFGKSALVVLAAAAGIARADFAVYTEPPIPTSAIPSFANPADAASWTTSVGVAAIFAYNRFVGSLGAPYQSSLSSVSSEVEAFVRTATNYSIPASVTEAGTMTFFSKPDWYTALPSGVRAFKEQQVSDEFSIIRSVIAQGQGQSTTASSTNGAAARPTGRAWVAGEFGVMAAAAAAAFL